MLEIAGKFKDTKRWTDAAKHFRLPYWDYYRPRGRRSSFPGGTASYDFSVPKTITEPNIMLFRPGATADEEKVRKRTKNPLYSYEFPQDNFMKQQWDLFDRRLIAAVSIASSSENPP
jgi:tyrosinase